MRIDARIVGDDVILRPQGHVIGLNGLIGQLMCESHYSRFVVDLRDVSVLDSEGLGTVVRAYMLVKRRNGSLRLARYAVS
jgi:anti-anti-sigma factor